MIKLRIVNYDDRMKLLGILGENGYKVSVEKEEIPPIQFKSILDSFIIIDEDNHKLNQSPIEQEGK